MYITRSRLKKKKIIIIISQPSVSFVRSPVIEFSFSRPQPKNPDTDSLSLTAGIYDFSLFVYRILDLPLPICSVINYLAQLSLITQLNLLYSLLSLHHTCIFEAQLSLIRFDSCSCLVLGFLFCFQIWSVILFLLSNKAH